MKRKCIICFRVLSSSKTGKEEIENLKEGTNDGIYFSSIGNYGSTVFDGGEFSGQTLEIYMCDECLKNRAHMIIVEENNKVTGVLQDILCT